jgi:polyisoprenoid-binding protein YceI
MRRAAGLLAALWAVGLSAPAAAEPQRYRLDPQRSFVHFEVLHFGTSTIHGRIGPVEGEVVLDRVAGTGEVGLRIATATVSTGFKFFDSRLRQPDLLASDEFPEAYFVASRFRFGTEAGQPALAEVRGEFTLRGRGVPLSLYALRFGCRPAGAALPAVSPPASTPTDLTSAAATATPPTAEVCGGDFEGEVLRSDFGATFGLPLVGDRVRLRVQVEGQRL